MQELTESILFQLGDNVDSISIIGVRVDSINGFTFHVSVFFDVCIKLFLIFVQMKKGLREDHDLVFNFGIAFIEDGVAAKFVVLDDFLETKFDVVSWLNDGALERMLHSVLKIMISNHLNEFYKIFFLHLLKFILVFLHFSYLVLEVTIPFISF